MCSIKTVDRIIDTCGVFANAIGARALRVEQPPAVNLDLGALNEQVQIYVRDFPAGRFDVYAELGGGNRLSLDLFLHEALALCLVRGQAVDRRIHHRDKAIVADRGYDIIL